MASVDRKFYPSSSAVFHLASVIIVVWIGCAAAAIDHRPLNAAIQVNGQTTFVCSSDTGIPHWVYSSNGKEDNTHSNVKSDSCSIYPEDLLHFTTQMINRTCTLVVRNATKDLAGVYTCIEGSPEADRFSALLTVVDPHPTIEVNNQSVVYEGHILQISCRTSYAAPLSSAPTLTPSLYFSTFDGRRITDVIPIITSDQVKASFTIEATFPVVSSFICSVFFPVMDKTKKQFASNTPDISSSCSSPVINVSSDYESRTDAPLSTTTACKSGSCDENRQTVKRSTADVDNNDWQSIDEGTGGDDNNNNAVTSAVEATTTLYPGNMSTVESWNETDTYSVGDDDGTGNYTNETRSINDDDTDVIVGDDDDDDDDNRTAANANDVSLSIYSETYLPDFNSNISESDSSYNFTNTDEERVTEDSEIDAYWNDLPVRNDMISNTTDMTTDETETTNDPYETTNHYETNILNLKSTTGGTKQPDNIIDINADDKVTTTNSFQATTTYYQTDSPNRSKNSAEPVVNVASSTGATTSVITAHHETDQFTANQDLNTTTNLTTELVTKDSVSPTMRNISSPGSHDMNRLVDPNFLFNAFKTLFPNFFRNEAPHLSSAYISSLVTSILIYLFIVN